MRVLPTSDVSLHSKSLLAFLGTRYMKLRLVRKLIRGLVGGGLAKTNLQGRLKQEVLSNFQRHLSLLWTICEFKMGLI